MLNSLSDLLLLVLLLNQYGYPNPVDNLAPNARVLISSSYHALLPAFVFSSNVAVDYDIAHNR